MKNPTLTLLENATLNLPIDSRLSRFLIQLIPALITSCADLDIKHFDAHFEFFII